MYERVMSFYSQGYALCTAGGVLLGHSYRATEAEAIASVFQNPDNRDAFWRAAQADGMTVQFVYAHIFTPKFFITIPSEEKADAA
ncbi:hypothetical protein RvVAT039_09190 [Agrobacterium vitis]|uniref:hypothetical protein n=1 Tax=Agrobacterium vitis TaxID=373 RepID=UPI0015DCCE36|nr:hypothetical protein [Agrobacterium vitis]BCH63703.1 hypothetical protein RvVAT039_09190 [Agrobacterium vitis]